ncbi:MAG: D-alanine--D-alanine ligase [Lachnospiraceae bacterium]|nr:D-alanine--D-alanine ligase [Lachnospiraceae bacterium]
MNIVVLAGGLSTERDVSFVSGNQVTEALRKNGHQVILLDLFMGYSDKEEKLDKVFERSLMYSAQVEGITGTAPDLEEVKKNRKDQSPCLFGPNVLAMCRMADIVFLALHGENGEDGRVQAAFDLFGIKYTGTGYLGSALAMDKGLTKRLFAANGIPTPVGISLKKESGAQKFTETGLSFPCMVKPCRGGSSVGVSMVNTEEAYQKALEEAFSLEEEVVVETCIKGREFSVGVIDFHALPVIEIAPKEGFYNYKNKYAAGSSVETCPAKIPVKVAKEMQHYAEEAARVLGLNTYSRMDFMLDQEDHIYCLEANTLPGMTPTSLLPQEALAMGMDFQQLCEKIIEISMEKYA